MSCSEKKFYSNIGPKRVGLCLSSDRNEWFEAWGRFSYVSDYSVGFVPERDYPRLGLREGVESLIMKGAIRVITPIGEDTGGDEHEG